MSFFLYFLMFSFVGAVFSSFAFAGNKNSPADFQLIGDFLQENWAVVALVLSELAAILPGKPKGILHAILKAGNRLFSNNFVSLKNFKL